MGLILGLLGIFAMSFIIAESFDEYGISSIAAYISALSLAGAVITIIIRLFLI